MNADGAKRSAAHGTALAVGSRIRAATMRRREIEVAQR
jgi:hypothetical protein